MFSLCLKRKWVISNYFHKIKLIQQERAILQDKLKSVIIIFLALLVIFLLWLQFMWNRVLHTVILNEWLLVYMVTIADPTSQLNRNIILMSHNLNVLKSPLHCICYYYQFTDPLIMKQLKISEINWLGQIAPCYNSIEYTGDEFSTILSAL